MSENRGFFRAKLTILHFAVYLLFSCTALFAPLAQANTCSPIFLKPSASAKVILELPVLHEQPLTPEVISAIESHRLFQRTQELREKSVTFSSERLLADGLLNPEYRGEGIQTLFIFKILKHVFPKAELNIFSFDRFAPNNIKICDSAENQRPSDFEMSFMKATNPTGYKIDRGQIRKTLGIPEKAKVMSIYVRTIRDFEPQQIIELIKSIDQKWKADVLFLNINLGTLNAYSPAMPMYKNMQAINLSELTGEQISLRMGRGQRTVIINDVAGYMPHAYAASNVAVIVGPVNFMEPLTVGTPTVILDNPAVTSKAFERPMYGMLQVATATGGARMAENADGVTRAIVDFIENPATITPPFMVQNKNKTQLTLLLDHIERWLVFKEILPARQTP